jgi:IstB-like ATP binding protein
LALISWCVPMSTEKCRSVITESCRSTWRFAEWAQTFGDEGLAAAILDRLLHDAEVLAINGPSFRLKGRLDTLRGRPDDHPEPT